MKKIVSLVLALCMLLFAMPVMAETAGETTGGLESLLGLLGGMTGEGSEGEGAEGEGGLNAILGLLGGLGGEGGEGAEGEGGLNAILGLLGGMTGEGGEEGADSEGGLGSLLTLLGGLGGEEAAEEATEEAKEEAQEGEAEEAQEEGGFDIGALLSTMGITPAAEQTYAALESIDQIYGNWQMNKVIVAGYEVSLAGVKALGIDIDFSMGIAISEEGIVMSTTGEEPKTIALTDCELADGALNMKMDEETAVLRLTEAGELCLGAGGEVPFEMHFVPAE